MHRQRARARIDGTRPGAWIAFACVLLPIHAFGQPPSGSAPADSSSRSAAGSDDDLDAAQRSETATPPERSPDSLPPSAGDPGGPSAQEAPSNGPDAHASDAAPARDAPAGDDSVATDANRDFVQDGNAGDDPPLRDGAPDGLNPPGERHGEGRPPAVGPGSETSSSIQYLLERVEVRGNGTTDTGVILAYVPLRRGEILDVDDPRVEAIRWRLLSTGWFDEVRLRLERGSSRGRVVLVIHVSERNTFIVQGVTLGFSEGVFNSSDPNVNVEPYFGLSLAELNLFGTGLSLEATGLLSIPQQGVRLRAGQASVAGSDFGLSGSLFFNNGREFFGHDNVVIALDECPMRGPGEPRCEESRNAVVVYRRYGASLGTGVDLATTLRFTLDWQFELVEVVDRPEAASHRRGTDIVPIDFSINDGWSRVSALRLGLSHDERDNPGLPTSGRFVFLNADVSTTLIGSSYDFVRVQAGWHEWFALPEAHHTLRLGLFAGAAVGETPFFYKFYVADLSDLIPSRVLELNLDRRAPPNLLDTSVREMRAQELAGRLDLEYSLWVYQSHDDIRGVILYGLVGAYALLDRDDLRVAIPGYAGFARVPIDLTFDIGVRLDTVVGVFELGFSTLLGFVSL